MSSGLAWDETTVPLTEPSNSFFQMEAAPRADYYVSAQPVAAPPGEVFNYNSGSTELLGLILRKVSGEHLDAFAKEALFDPLDIKDWEWEGCRVQSVCSLRVAPAATRSGKNRPARAATWRLEWAAGSLVDLDRRVDYAERQAPDVKFRP